MAHMPDMRRKLVAILVLAVVAAAPVSAPRAAEGRSVAATAVPAASSTGDSCRRLPAGKRLKLNLKPNTELVDLVSWISAITCKQFILPSTLPSQSRTVTIISPQSITVAEAYALFLDALEAIGLTVYSSGNVLRVIETSKIKSSPIPVIIDSRD